jgi:hypothetical protein
MTPATGFKRAIVAMIAVDPVTAAPPGSGRYRLSTAVGDVTRGLLLRQTEIEGLQSDFFVPQVRIVHGILNLLELPNRPAAASSR